MTPANEMLPKLKVDGLGWNVEQESCEFDQARYFPYNQPDLVIVAEGRVIRSYEDLLQLAKVEEHKSKEFLEVSFLPIIVGG